MATSINPSAFVSWAHREPEWTTKQADAWREEVASFVGALRRSGINADVDLHHLYERGVDWTRFGEQGVTDSDWVLVVLSPAWRSRWEGRNEPTVGAGAVAEANALKSGFSRNQKAFIDKVVLITLPSMTAEDIVPTGLHGVQRMGVRTFDEEGLAPLLRLLTGQDEYPLQPLGSIPQLPPAPIALPASEETTPVVAASSISRSRAPATKQGASRRRPGILFRPKMTTREILDAGSCTPGGPDPWMVYPGVLLLRLAFVAQPSVRIHGFAVTEALDSAAESARSYIAANLRPAALGTLIRKLSGEWSSGKARRWNTGLTSKDPIRLAERETSAATFVTDPAVLTIDRTLPIHVRSGQGVVYDAAFEPVIAADVIAGCAFAGSLFDTSRAVDLMVQIASAPGGGGLVSAESYAPIDSPFMDPHEGIVPPATLAPSHHLESTRAQLDDLQNHPESVARKLLDDWLVTFRERDLFAELAPNVPTL